LSRSRKGAAGRKRTRKARAIESADVEIARSAAPLRERPAIRALGAISELADQPPLIALSSAVLGAGLVRLNPRLTRAGGRMLAAHLLATFIKRRVKHAVDRTRPGAVVDGDRYRFERGRHPHDHDLGSFPSGHTAGIVAVTRALSREYPDAAAPGLAASLAVAAVQIPRCAHYPGDIAAGAAVGLAAEAIVDRLFGAVRSRFPRSRPIR
jgi:membrane-associated phospholipid phosphatase